MADRIVVVEDDRDLRVFLGEMLEDAGYQTAVFGTADAALRFLQADEQADLVITDLILPGMRGHELLDRLQARSELPVIIITAFGSIESAVQMVKAGAYDYLTKPFGTEELLLIVERALQDSRPRRELARVARQPVSPPPGFIAASDAMQGLFQTMQQMASSRFPVLIAGESGTGKELVARGLHHLSGRQPLVVLNCAALPDHLLESELFGHEKGAFTGADRTKQGLFEAASGGTLFLDEIGELPLSLQPKLLRALEYGEVRRVGATQARHVDLRAIAATNRDLEEEVRHGRFRDDLFWRLNVLHLQVPPLRDRPEDIHVLADHFLRAASGEGDGAAGGRPVRITPEAMELLRAYPWPGNVRELRNVIERAATLSYSSEIQPHDLPERIRSLDRDDAFLADAARRQSTLRELERRYILEVLQQTEGNKTRAAEILGLDRKTLYRKVEAYRSDPGSE